MTDQTRLIEVAFPLRQTSLDSVHEKNVRHGHISTLHIWPARRPLAACRAALIATLLPDPGNKKDRDDILLRLGGRITEKTVKKELANGKIQETIKEETVGGILHWGREGDDIEWFREKIKEAYGGRMPKVLDPFAGGGAIPLEAMRLGCEVTAIDINPVAWFILKCTLEYPQKLAGEKLPLPDFALQDREFMESFFKAQGYKNKSLKEQIEKLGFDLKETITQPNLLEIKKAAVDADLAWHVRAWGLWVLNEARKDLAKFYPTYSEFEPIFSKKVVATEDTKKAALEKGLKKVYLLNDGNLDLIQLNEEFEQEYLENDKNPRWIPKPTVAYLWARTVKCKACRSMMPLLKTRWLCKKDNKRVLLTMEVNGERSGVIFGIENDVPIVGGNTTQKKAHDKKVGDGTMSKSGAKCPCCGSIMTMEDIRFEGKAGRLGQVMTAVVVDGQNGKEYRLPTEEEVRVAEEAGKELEGVFADIPFGLPTEPLPSKEALGFRVPLYGFDQWYKLFSDRQLLALGIFVKKTRTLREILQGKNYSNDWLKAIISYSTIAIDRLADYSSAVCSWHNSKEQLRNTFGRFALPIIWDFTEVFTLSQTSGGYLGAVDWIARYIEHALIAVNRTLDATVTQQSAIAFNISNSVPQNEAKAFTTNLLDVICTDPPYYDAIPYSDLMDFFGVWLRRSLHGLSPEIDEVFKKPLSPKWNHEENDGELIDDSSRFGGDKQASKTNYEEGMYRVFKNCYEALQPEGRLVIVFAHKHPDAWETLVSAIIRAGFIVDASWPIQTEMGNRTRALASAALSSSVWLVCKKRPKTTRPGWDNRVLEEMRSNITEQLRRFWDDGIRGPDFVWAATGPALEAYSKYPAVKKANEQGELLTVSEFLQQVRRLVLEFVVGRVISASTSNESVSELDDITTYYLLHRHDFGMEEAPIGGCILYAVSCGLSDKDLATSYDILANSGKNQPVDEDDEDETEEDDSDSDTGKGSKVKLKQWQQRKRKAMGYEGYGNRPIPLIDKIHRLMHLWKEGDGGKVDDYLQNQGLRRNSLFNQVLQALIELAVVGGDERALLESLSNHVVAIGGTDQLSLFKGENYE